jgi:MoxR-like ATPase
MLQPEGIEDLAVYQSGLLSDVRQVKALGSDLALSDLEPSGRRGFFARLADRLGQQPDLKAQIITFGPVGQELAQALAGEQRARGRVLQKLRNAGISADDASRALDATTIEHADEESLRREVVDATRTLLTGHDPAVAADLLIHWIYVASEERRLLSRVVVVERMSAIGRYLAERGTFATEWFTTIQPLIAANPSNEDALRLREEFANGIAARFEHVVAGAAVARDRFIAEVEVHFRTSRIVLIRGESGAGKTTLAFQYLAALPETWRFRVRDLSGRQHGRAIALALLGHARALQVPLYVHVDVAPSDQGWVEVVADLAANPEIRVLVSIREEDLRRTPLSAEFAYAEVALSLDEGEARQIFEGLRSRMDVAYPTFEDAWSRFGGTSGPLLEFVHLCAQGIGLEVRLDGQVRRLRDEVRAGALDTAELDLLRIVSVASAYDGAVDVLSLQRALVLPDLGRTIQRFESEYLLRSTGDGRFLVGLHPIRSNMLAEFLTDAAISPWVESARAALPALDESTLANFLLFSFSRRQDDRDTLVAEVLRLVPRTWIGCDRILEALLWLGVDVYVAGNAELFAEVHASHPSAGWLMIDWDIARIGNDTAADMFASLVRTLPGFTPAAEAAAGYRARQSHPRSIADPARDWLRAMPRWPTVPLSGPDWAAFAAVSFWANRLGVSVGAQDLLTTNDWVRILDTLAVGELAEVGLGVEMLTPIPQWWLDGLALATRRLQAGLSSIELRDDGVVVGIDYLIDPDALQTRENYDPHRESMWRLELLRLFLPNRERYETQGHGHRLVEADHDPTIKSIQAENLPLPPLVRLNSIFKALTEISTRPSSWRDFWDRVLAQRQAALDVSESLVSLVRTHFRQRDPVNRGPAIGAIVDAYKALGPTVPLPRTAVDEWGFTTETSAEGARKIPTPPGGARVATYSAFWRSHRDFWASVDNVGKQVADGLIYQVAIGRPGRATTERIREIANENGVSDRAAQLVLRNLIDSRTRRLEYARRTLEFISADLLPRARALDARESPIYETVTDVWRWLVEYPNQVVPDVAGVARAERDRVVMRMRRRVMERLTTALPEPKWTVIDRDLTFEGRPVLLVVGDWASASDSLTAAEPTVAAIAAAFRDADDNERQQFVDEVPTAVVVSEVRRRLVDDEGIVLSNLVVGSPSFQNKWFGLVPRRLEAPFLRAARLRSWANPAIHIADGALAAAVQVWARAAHLEDIKVDVTVLDETGKAIADAHLQKMLRGLRADAGVFREEAKEVGRQLAARGRSDLEAALLYGSAELDRVIESAGGFDVDRQLARAIVGGIESVTIARAAWIDLFTAEPT